MKAILVIDVDEKYIGAIGTEIQFINQKYNCKWKLKPMPEKRNYSEELADTRGFDMYTEGWNACLEELEK